MAEAPNKRDAKLLQWLEEAHAKEAELETDLTAHIGLTKKQAYKKRLQQHLKETRAHKRQVASRIKKLGGEPGSTDIPGVPNAVGEIAGKATAAVKGQVGVARAAATSEHETHLRNAQEEFREEHVEIAIYNRIETFAEAVGDRDSAKLARSIKRDEQRMAKYLEAEITRLVKSLVTAEVPRDQRPTRSRRRRTTTRRSSGRSRAGSSGRASARRSARART